MLQQQDQRSVQSETKSWYVLYTKPRHEKKLAERLQSEGWTVYCPLKMTIKQWSDRKKVVEEALFPSFIFIQCHEQDRDQVFVHASAVRYLYWLRKPAVVRPEEIESIRHWMGEANHASIAVESIPVGSKVRVGAGPLMGQLGKLKEHRGDQVSIVLDQLGIQVRLKAHETPLMTA
ncbi:UpxY family transcription antiterminator [Schleiferiaceae bacterium]|nr:UpxY family transcription antiterminator [Schleiferiaceae bacterium]